MDTTQILDRAETLMREMATTLGQPALDIAMAAAQAQAAGRLSLGVGALVAASILGVIALRYASRAFVPVTKKWSWGTEVENEPTMYLFPTVFCGVGATAFGFGSIVTLLDAANWIAAFDGRIALALKVLG